MADVFSFYVYDDRSIQFNIAEPIMLEDMNVTQFKFRIPKSINGFDMTNWAWWFVYVNPSCQKYSVPLTFTDDEDEPEEYANATYTVDYGMSGTAGTVQFALEAINADATTDEILNEWHTKTYATKVISTLQGNQTEFTQSEFDIISAKLEEIMELIEGGGGGGGGSKTSDDITNESNVSGATVTGALNSLSDQIAHKQDALTFDNSPTSGSNNPVKSSGIYSALQGKAGTSVATTSANGLMSSTDKGRLDTLYADYSSAITALGV